MDEKELEKQLSSYADAITGFSVLQAAGFAIVAIQRDIACLLFQRWLAAMLAFVGVTALYLVLVTFCHLASGTLGSTSEDHVARVAKWIWIARYAVVILVGCGEIALIAGIHSPRPFYDCPPKVKQASSATCQ